MSEKEKSAPSGTAPSELDVIDVWSDGAESDSDKRIREFTVRELEKSKKCLPKDRYEALVAAVGEILRNHYSKEEEVRESVKTKISEFRKEVVPDDAPGCVRNKFDPRYVNGARTAEYLAEAISTPENLEAFKKALKSDPELLWGFLRYWAVQEGWTVNDKSNAKRILASKGQSEAVAKLDAFHRSLADEEGVVLNAETLARNAGDVGVVEQLNAKYNFFKKTDGKYYERAGNKVSTDFSAIVSGASISKYSNAEIADVFSYAYVHSNPGYPLWNESSRVPDAITKIKGRFANDPAWLIKISEGWGGNQARVQPAIDKRLQVGDAKGVREAFITTAKESFKAATEKLVERFATEQLGAAAEKEKIARVSEKIKEAVEKTPADSQSNYFEKVGRKIERILKDAGVPNVEAKDNLKFIRQMLGLTVASREFDEKNDPKRAKYAEAFKDVKTLGEVDKKEAELLARNPSDAEAVRKAAETARLRLSNPKFFWGFRSDPYDWKPLSNEAAESVFRHKWPVTAQSVETNLGRTMKAEAARDELERQAGADRFGKPLESMTVRELEAARDELRNKKNPTEEDRKTLGLLEKYVADKADARREYVAIATGKSYDDVVRLERSGRSIDSLFEQSRKTPLFPEKADGKNEFRQSAQDAETFVGNFGSRRTLDVGESRTFTFEGTRTPVTVRKTADASKPYLISVNGKEAFECGEKDVRAHMSMAKFLCENGLDFLAPATAEMLKRKSVRNGDLATAEDGEFWEKERKLIFTGFAKAFGLTDFPMEAQSSSEMRSHLRAYSEGNSNRLREEGFRKGLLDENGNIRNREAFLHTAT